MTYYKVLSRGHRACHGGIYRYTPNRWTKRIENIIPCESGYHICTLDQLARWLYAVRDALLPLEVWECEATGISGAGEKYIAERIRITTLVGTLDEYDLRWLGTLFAEQMLVNTDDPRVGECINAVRAYSLGFIDDLSAARNAAPRGAPWGDDALNAAWNAAERAAKSAAERAAPRGAPWDYYSALNAAWNAAVRAAKSAAERAALNAAWGDDALNAAERAAWGAAWNAAERAAWGAYGRIVLDYFRDGAR
jgi:hypothetical protein